MAGKENIIPIGSDHGGFELKEYLKEELGKLGYSFKDFGTYSEDSVDYPDFIHPLANSIQEGEFELGIIMCGTGIGMSIMANKVKGIRAALVHDLFTAEATRLHNDTNILAMGGRVIELSKALKIVDIWLDTDFSNDERHVRRIAKIDNYKGE